jgi:hypothetical protein
MRWDFIGAGTRCMDTPDTFAAMSWAVTPLIGLVGSIDALNIVAVRSDGLVKFPRGSLLLVSCLAAFSLFVVVVLRFSKRLVRVIT